MRRLILILILGTILMGCSRENLPEQVLSAQISSMDFQIVMHDKVGDALVKLGTPVTTFESKSCAFEGLDRFYKFEGYELAAYEKNGTWYWLSLHTWDENVRFSEEVSVGMLLDDALVLLPEPTYTADQLKRFEIGRTLLTLTYTSDGIVETITMSAKLD